MKNLLIKNQTQFNLNLKAYSNYAYLSTSLLNDDIYVGFYKNKILENKL